jgi:RNA polymerase sigma-70 factor, ECF subfamily
MYDREAEGPLGFQQRDPGFGSITAVRRAAHGARRGMAERECIERSRNGDPAAMRELYERHAPRVFMVIRSLAGDDALAEDWAQEAWVRAFRALPGFRADAQFATWLHRIAVNSALQGRRWRERRTNGDVQLNESLVSHARADGAVLRIDLQRALDRLPAGMRQVLVLHSVDGFTHEEIATELGISAGTSKSQLFRARARLREMLQPTVTYAAAEPTPAGSAALAD